MSKQQCICITNAGTQCIFKAPGPDFLCGKHNQGKCKKTVSSNSLGATAVPQVYVERPQPKLIAKPKIPSPKVISKPLAKKPINVSHDEFGDLDFEFDPSELDDIIQKKPLIPQQKPMDINTIKIEDAIDRVAESIDIIMATYKQKKSKLEVTKLMDALCKILTSKPPGKLSLKQALTPYISKVLRDLPEHITKVPQQRQKDYLRKIILKSAGTLKKLFDNVCSFNDGGSRTSDRINEEIILSELSGIEKADEELTETFEADVLHVRLNLVGPSLASQPIGANAQPVEKVKTKQLVAPIAVSKK